MIPAHPLSSPLASFKRWRAKVRAQRIAVANAQLVVIEQQIEEARGMALGLAGVCSRPADSHRWPQATVLIEAYRREILSLSVRRDRVKRRLARDLVRGEVTFVRG